jgi:peptide/nickel transport system substrate-binding protein
VRYQKLTAAIASVAALASLAACGGVKSDAGDASGSAITIGTTDKIVSLDPAGS